MSGRLLCLLALALPAAAGELRSAEGAIQRTLAKVRPAVVTVFTPNPKDFDLTGAIVSSSGLIVTVRKPLMEGTGTVPAEVPIRYPGKGDTETLDVIDEDAATDTVLLKPRRYGGPYLKIASSDGVHLGMWALLVGNAFGAGQESTPTASLGVVSGLVRERGELVEVHASALVNPGSIGAPVVDAAGKLIGITAPSTTASGGQTVLVPFDRVRRAYLEKGSAGAREFSRRPVERKLRDTVTDAFGLVVSAAAERGKAFLVGVRAGGPPPEKPEATEKKGEGPKPPPAPAPVPGKLPAYDRCSGVIVSSEGWIVCPLRITGWPGPPRPLTVDLLDGRSLEGKVLGRDERLRLALVAVAAKGLPVPEEAPLETLVAGSFAVALGFPHEEPARGIPQVTVGILSRTEALAQLDPALRALQTDAGVAGGNRGGPLLDIDGRLLGCLLDVNDTDPQGYFTRAKGSYEGNAGLGFAVPLHVLRPLLARLAAGAVLKAAFLGVGVEKTPGGVRVAGVTEKNSAGDPTAAKSAGLEPGDILLSIGGKELREAGDVRPAIARHAAGDRVEIVFLRKEERKTVTVMLGER